MLTKILSFALAFAPEACQTALNNRVVQSINRRSASRSTLQYTEREGVISAYLVLAGLVWCGIVLIAPLNFRHLWLDGNTALALIAHFLSLQFSVANPVTLIFTIALVSYLAMIAGLFFSAWIPAAGYFFALMALTYTMIIFGDIAFVFKSSMVKGVIFLVLAITFALWKVDYPSVNFSVITVPTACLFAVLAVLVSKDEVVRFLLLDSITLFAKIYIPLITLTMAVIIGGGISRLILALTSSSSSSVSPVLTASFALLMIGAYLWTLFIELLVLIFIKSKSRNSG